MAQPKFTSQMTVEEFDRLFPTDEACKAYLVARRWPGAISCPRCGNEKVWTLKAKPFHWQCNQCGPRDYRFSVLVGTVFENTNVGLRTWFKVIYLMLTSKKGISSLQVHRMIGFGSYETALCMTHRIRAALVDPEFRKLMGIVEVDETYVSGKNKKPALRQADPRHRWRREGDRHWCRRAGGQRGSPCDPQYRYPDPSRLRQGDREREGLAGRHRRTFRLPQPAWTFPHESARHGQGEYVRGLVHTGTIDGFWSLLKRGIMGSFHHVSAKYLPLYVAEFEWRYNNRNNPDIFPAAIARC